MTAPSRLVIGPISTGLQTYDKPFLINNDAFPTLQNALCWRRRLIKKTGSEKLGQLQRSLVTANMGATSISFNIVPASVAVPIPSGVSEFSVGSIIYTDADLTAAAMVNLITTAGSSGTLNRQTGAVTLNFPALANNTAIQYIPGLPVMGIEEFEAGQTQIAPIDFPVNVFFDTVYSYLFNGSIFIDNSFYSSGALVWWSGKSYQQFDSCNYFRAMFVTNNNPGAFAFAIASVSGGGAPTVTVKLPAGVTDMRLQTNDLVFINETTGAGSATLNLKTFTITRTGANTFTIPSGAVVIDNNTGVVFPLNRLVTLDVGGSAQIGDGIRWYDGVGFNNFTPPLDNLSTNGSSTYLVGCRVIIPFGNRLLALGTFEANSNQIIGGVSIYYPNRIRYCQVTATPFYANSPANVTSTPLAWASNIQGFGGFIDLDTTERIISADVTQGSLILGMESEQRKAVNTGIETDPFSLQVINPDYGTAGTHATIPMDKGILTVGEYGFITTSSYDANRFDLPIIEQIFQVNPDSNGYERICGGRDFVNEVLYFSYPSIFNPQDLGSNPNFFPDTTLVFNYREPSFGIWFESPTTYGLVKSSVASTRWAALTDFVWEDWDIPWNALPDSASTYPFVAFGTPQGFIMLKWANESTNDPSMQIQNITGPNVDGTYSITSVNYNLSPGMFVGFFPPAAGIPAFIGKVAYLGDTSGMNITSIFGVNFDTSDPTVLPGNIVPGTWQMSIVDLPFIQSKQFQAAWANARKTRIGAQKYFLDTTSGGEFTVDILGSQNPTSLNNNTVANPEPSLISNAIVRTRPDDSLGINGTQAQQTQIWHRLASSCIGDTVQLQFTFSEAQMRKVPIAISPWVLHTAILDLYPSRTLA